MKYLILGGGGIFAVHTAKYLLSKNETSQVVSVGRNRERSEAFTLGVGKNDSRYSYKQIHITFIRKRKYINNRYYTIRNN